MIHTEKEIQGHTLMSLERFAEDTRHMVVYEVIKEEFTAGFKGELIRVFLSAKGFERVLQSQERGEIKILDYADIRNGGYIFYDLREIDPCENCEDCNYRCEHIS